MIGWLKNWILDSKSEKYRVGRDLPKWKPCVTQKQNSLYPTIMEGRNAYSYSEDGTFMVFLRRRVFSPFLGGAQSESQRQNPAPKLAARASYDGINFQTWIIPKRLIDSFPHFPVTPPKKRGEKSSDPFLGFFLNFCNQGSISQIPAFCEALSRVPWLSMLARNPLQRRSCRTNASSSKVEAPSYASTTNINSRDTPRSKDSQGLWYLWLKYLGCERFNCFRSSLRNPTFAMGCLM